MGFDANGTLFLLAARRSGVAFRHTATLGRQMIYAKPAALSANLSRFGYTPTANLLSARYAEPFLHLLGAESITSIDVSPYEHATHIHDLNQPIPDTLHHSFSAVIDGGSLEHIFNVPVALRSALQMVREGGHFLALTPANNHPNHGFYQFSPTLFAAILSAENGYAIERMVIYEEAPYPKPSQWYAVDHALLSRQRVEFRTGYAATLLIQARRVSVKPIFERTPQQPYYEQLWNQPEEDSEQRTMSQSGRSEAIKARLKMLLPPVLLNWYTRLRGGEPYPRGFRSPAFTPITHEQLFAALPQ